VVTADQSLAARREAAIRQALDKPVNITAHDRPLDEVVRDIGRQADVPLVLDRATLIDEGVRFDQPVTFQTSNTPARSALKLILEPLQLTWLIRHEVLIVTTAAKAGELLEARVYDMTDVAPKYRIERGAIRYDLRAISQAIESTIQPDCWDAGNQQIPVFHSGGICVLVIRQTQAIHEEIAAFLEDLRELQRKRTASMPDQTAEAIPDAAPPRRGWTALGPLDPRRDALVRGNNQFALELYARLARETSGNLLISPYCVSGAVALAYAGARGDTAREIDATMHYTLRQQDLPAAFGSLRNMAYLWGWSARGDFSSQLWGQEGIAFAEEFQKTLHDFYGTTVATVDFSDPAIAAHAVNDWAAVNSGGSILRLANSVDFNETTRLVVANAVHFVGSWSQPFSRNATKLEEFSIGAGAVEAAMMHSAADRSRYAFVEGVQILDKPYGNGELSMIVLLPARTPSGLSDLQSALTEPGLVKWLAAEDAKEADVYLPRFKLESAFNLRRELELLGMHSAFDAAHADFSGVSATKKLALGGVIHKAYAEFDEQAPPTAAGAGTPRPQPGSPSEKRPVFRADHPFVFLIRDNRTGCILFIGRLVNPAA
jgi:serpin B